MRLLTVSLLIISVTSLLAGCCGNTAPPAPQIYEVTYRIGGTTSRADLTYENAGGDTEQREVKLPWELSFEAKRGQFVYIAAQNKSDHGTIITEILINGEEWKRSESEGAYVIAKCSGQVGE